MIRFSSGILIILFVALQSISQAASPGPLSTVLRMLNGRPTIVVNGDPVYPMIYALTDVPGGRWSWEELPKHNIEEFARHGTRLYQVHLFFEQMWKEDGSLDITPAVKQIRGVLDVRPDAAVIMRLHVAAPSWWIRTHPDEWVRYADTGYDEESTIGFPRIIEEDNFPVRRVSMASQSWKREAGEVLRRFLAALASTEEGSALIGVQPANGIYGEWHNWGFFRNEPDTSAPMTMAFRAWLRSKYGSDRELQKAWNDPSAAFDRVRVPSMKERETSSGIFRDPAREQKTIDYYTCVHELVADDILYFARIVKTAWPRPILAGTFYGYFFSTFGRQAAGGHLALQRLLNSPDIDYLAGPQAYEPESLLPGDPFRSRSLTASVRMHGKLWLDEMDNEPAIPTSRDARHDILLRTAVANVRRNTVSSYTRGAGLWYYDFGVAGADLDGYRHNARGSWGFWDHPVIQENIRLMRQEFEKRMARPFVSASDVLFVYDTKSVYHTASLRGADPVTPAVIDYSYLAALRSGVAVDAIHLDDLPKTDLSQYRTVVFGNTFVLTKEERDYIRTHVAQDKRTIIWLYAPGYSDGRALNASHIGELTGMSVRMLPSARMPEVRCRIPGDTAQVSYALASKPIAPLFAIDDDSAEAFGYYGTGDTAAIARKTFADHTAWFIAAPGKTVEPLRSILRSSGAHCYVADSEIVYAGGGIVAIHTKNGGAHHVRLRNGRTLSFDLPEGASTLLLDADTGASLLP